MKIHSHQKTPEALYIKMKNKSLLLCVDHYKYRVILYDISIFKKSFDFAPYATTKSFYAFMLDENIEFHTK